MTNKIKISGLCLILLLTLGLFINTNGDVVKAASDVKIKMDDKLIAFTEDSGSPFIDTNSRTLVPLRITMESYGTTVDWDSENKTAYVKKDNVTVKVPMNKKYIFVNDNLKLIDTESVNINGRIYLPIRFVLEEFDAEVGWDSANKTVIINHKKTSPVSDDVYTAPTEEELKKYKEEAGKKFVSFRDKKESELTDKEKKALEIYNGLWKDYLDFKDRFVNNYNKAMSKINQCIDSCYPSNDYASLKKNIKESYDLLFEEVFIPQDDILETQVLGNELNLIQYRTESFVDRVNSMSNEEVDDLLELMYDELNECYPLVTQFAEKIRKLDIDY